MGKHEVPQPKRSVRHSLTRRALHPVTHVITIVMLHVAALTVIEKTPLLTLLLLH